MQDLHDWVNPKNGKHSPMIAPGILEIMRENADVSMGLGWITWVQWGFFWYKHSPMRSGDHAKTCVRSYKIDIYPVRARHRRTHGPQTCVRIVFVNLKYSFNVHA